MRLLVAAALGLGLMLSAMILLWGQEAPAGKVRKCADIGPGGWFPGTKEELKAAVDKYFADAGDVAVPGKPLAVISPHAGYRFSGPTAAYAFKPLVGKKYSRVILLGPTHRVYVQGGMIADADAFETPLGLIPLDKSACDDVVATGVVRHYNPAGDREHSLQNELPFLQTALGGGWKLVPVIVGPDPTETEIAKMGEALKKLLTPDTLIVVSSDFTHYGPNYDFIPFRADVKENLKKLDQGAIDFIVKDDWKGFRDYVDRTRATICGRAPITVMLKALEGRKDVKGTLVRYQTSGELTGDFTNSVSYAAIVMTEETKADKAGGPGPKVDAVIFAAPADDKAGEAKEPKKEAEPADTLTEAEQRTLLRIARDQLKLTVAKAGRVEVEKEQYDLTKKLLSDGAVFVTLKNDERLRGCIGDIVARQPLYVSVIRNTINAAARDPRFAGDRITEQELPDIDIEISYLTPMKEIKDYRQIVVGKHGVMLSKDGLRAVFLPQVATEQRWDLDTMLKQLCMKAGLPPNAYKADDCKFWIFEAQVFGEKEFKKKDA